MQRISFAPVLSATLSRDSCWITVLSLSPWFSSPDEPGGTISWMSPAHTGLSFCSAEPSSLRLTVRRATGGLLGLLDDLDDAPALGGGQRAGLHDPDPVAHATLVLLVVRLELAGAAQDLAVQPVLDAVLDGDDHGLVHLVADHQALASLAVRTGSGDRCLRCPRGPGRLGGLGRRLGTAHVGSLAHAAPSCSAPEPAGFCRIPSSRSRTTV